MRVHIQLDASETTSYTPASFAAHVGRMVPVTGCGLDPHGGLALLVAAEVTAQGHAVLTVEAQDSVARALTGGIDGTFYLLSWRELPGQIEATPLQAQAVCHQAVFSRP